MDSLYNKVFKGEHKYTVGILFIFGNMAGFFLNMRKLKVSDKESLMILATLIFFARLVV